MDKEKYNSQYYYTISHLSVFFSACVGVILLLKRFKQEVEVIHIVTAIGVSTIGVLVTIFLLNFILKSNSARFNSISWYFRLSIFSFFVAPFILLGWIYAFYNWIFN